MVSSEQDILKKMAEAEKELDNTKRLLAEAKRRWTDAETGVIEAKLHLDRVKEELRVHHLVTPKHEPTYDEKEIERFRQAYPEICQLAKDRDRKRGSDE